MTTLDGHSNHRFPFFLPDSRQFLFQAVGTPEAAGIYLGELDSPETWLLTTATTPGVYLASGWLVWVRSGALMAQRLDLERKALTGDPVILADSAAGVSVSTTGLVAYRSGEINGRQLAWFDRMGKALGIVGEPGALSSPELSPDGRRIAIDRAIQGNRDVWLIDSARGPSRASRSMRCRRVSPLGAGRLAHRVRVHSDGIVGHLAQALERYGYGGTVARNAQ